MQVAQLQNNNQLQDVLVNNVDSMGNPDGLRLQMTYKKSNHVFNGGGTTLALLDYPNSRFATTEALYRLSGSGDKGHGDLSCENCHGSTHAIWPNKNPFSNDNKAAMDLQGHAGPIIECSTCHTGDLGVTLDGPHGMHPVGDTRFSAGGHEKLAEKNKDACRACHGKNGEGSVLSRVATDRTLTKDEHGNKTIHLAKGELVTCNLCHKNKL
nr:cytochrome c3 family protein [Thiolapillus sp.]